VARRNPWAILYASLVLGDILAPYCSVGLLLGLGLFFHFPLPHFGLPGFVLLGVSTVLLLGVFVARTQVEQRLRQRLGRFFSPLRVLLLVLAAGYLVLVTLVTADPFPFAPPSGAGANFFVMSRSVRWFSRSSLVSGPHRGSNGPSRSGSTAPTHSIGPIARPDMSRSRADF